VLLHAILPRGGDEGDYRDTASFHRSNWWVADWNVHFTPVHAVNARLQELAASRPWLHFLDCSESFLRRAPSPAAQLEAQAAAAQGGGVGAMGGSAAAATAGGPQYIEPSLMYDLLHFSPDGYREWAACLLPRVEGLMTRV